MGQPRRPLLPIPEDVSRPEITGSRVLAKPGKKKAGFSMRLSMPRRPGSLIRLTSAATRSSSLSKGAPPTPHFGLCLSELMESDGSALAQRLSQNIWRIAISTAVPTSATLDLVDVSSASAPWHTQDALRTRFGEKPSKLTTTREQ